MNQSKLRPGLTLLAGALIGVSLPALARAQTPPAETSAETPVGGLEEIIVTARKREESMQDVPIAVTALSGEEMQRASMTLIEDVHTQVPNLNISTAGGESKLRLFIRGVGQNDALAINDPGVGMYVDGVYLTRVTNLSFALNDIERVEVLRGPQGTLFGKNTIGGAINVLTRDPQRDFEAEVGGGVGSWDRLALNGKLNVPLVDDRILARLAVQYDRHDGWARNRFNGEKVMRSEEFALLGGLKFILSDKTDFTLKLNLSDTRSDGTILKAFSDIAAGEDPLDFNLNLSGDAHHTNTSITGTLVSELNDDVTFKSISNYRKSRYFEEVVDYDGGPSSLLDQFRQRAPFKQWSQEFQLLGSSFEDRLSWVLGAFYQGDDGFSGEFDCIVRVAPGACGPSTFAVVFDFKVNQRTDSYALFGQASYAFTDRLSATAGLRWSRDEKRGSHTLSAAAGGPFFRYEADWSEFTPKVSLDYKVTPDLLVYAGVSKGYKAGQLPGRAMSDAEVSAFLLDPEEVWSYETGFKADLFDRRLRLNAAAFHVDYSNLQIQTFATNPDGTLNFSQANAPESRIRGFEVEALAQLAKGLRLGASLGYLDSRYTRFLVGDDDRSDLKLEHSPEYQYTLFADYTHDLPRGDQIWGRTSYAYIDDQFYAQSNSPGVFQEGYGLLNASIGYIAPDQRFEVTLSGRNLTDKVYSNFAIDLFGGARAYGKERHFTLDFVYRF